MPRYLTRIHRVHGTPWVALLATAIGYAVLIGFPVTFLAVVEMWTFSGVYILIFLALWRLRARGDARAAGTDGGYRYVIPAGKRGIWWIILPPIALIVIAMFTSGVEYITWGGSVVLSGFAVYPLVARWRRRRMPVRA